MIKIKVVQKIYCLLKTKKIFLKLFSIIIIFITLFFSFSIVKENKLPKIKNLCEKINNRDSLWKKTSCGVASTNRYVEEVKQIEKKIQNKTSKNKQYNKFLILKHFEEEKILKVILKNKTKFVWSDEKAKYLKKSFDFEVYFEDVVNYNIIDNKVENLILLETKTCKTFKNKKNLYILTGKNLEFYKPFLLSFNYNEYRYNKVFIEAITKTKNDEIINRINIKDLLFFKNINFLPVGEYTDKLKFNKMLNILIPKYSFISNEYLPYFKNLYKKNMSINIKLRKLNNDENIEFSHIEFNLMQRFYFFNRSTQKKDKINLQNIIDIDFSSLEGSIFKNYNNSTWTLESYENKNTKVYKIIHKEGIIYIKKLILPINSIEKLSTKLLYLGKFPIFSFKQEEKNNILVFSNSKPIIFELKNNTSFKYKQINSNWFIEFETKKNKILLNLDTSGYIYKNNIKKLNSKLEEVKNSKDKTIKYIEVEDDKKNKQLYTLDLKNYTNKYKSLKTLNSKLEEVKNSRNKTIKYIWLEYNKENQQMYTLDLKNYTKKYKSLKTLNSKLEEVKISKIDKVIKYIEIEEIDSQENKQLYTLDLKNFSNNYKSLKTLNSKLEEVKNSIDKTIKYIEIEDDKKNKQLYTLDLKNYTNKYKSFITLNSKLEEVKNSKIDKTIKYIEINLKNKNKEKKLYSFDLLNYTNFYTKDIKLENSKIIIEEVIYNKDYEFLSFLDYDEETTRLHVLGNLFNIQKPIILLDISKQIIKVSYSSTLENRGVINYISLMYNIEPIFNEFYVLMKYWK